MEQDLQALHGFLDETNESLQGIENAFISLEKDPGNMDIINQIFRPVHSMKGNSGFFGLTHINKFAHRMEDLLDFIRRGEILVDSEIIDILLTGIDYLQKMLDRVVDDPSDITLRPEEEQFLIEKVEACKPAAVVGSLQSVLDLEELLKDAEEQGIDLHKNSLLAGALDHIEKLNEDLRKYLREQSRKQEIHIPYPEGLEFFLNDQDVTDLARHLAAGANALALHKPLSPKRVKAFKEALAELPHLIECTAEIERVLDEVGGLANFLDDEFMAANDDYCKSTAELIGQIMTLFEIKGDLDGPTMLGEILVAEKIVTKEQIEAALGKQAKVGEILKQEGMVSEEDLQKALALQGRRNLNKHLKKNAGQEKTKTIRIDQNKLDSFADSVGELFINVDSFNFLKKKIEMANVDIDTMAKFSNTVTALDDMLSKLQENVMSVRKVPVGTLFQRFPRVIRQLASSLDKKIDFQIVGEQTVIDKDLLETIENPLVHILRNSVDHGIERPDDRIEKNKPAQGVLELSATVDEYNVYLTIKDDGAGINPQKMKEVAVSKGFMDEDEVSRLTDHELVNLIFKPGFSSAKEVSDVSGRGVGMDAVMNGLDKCNGSIDVQSVVDEGTTVVMTIPLTRTLVTKDALIIEIAQQLYAIPSEDITTTVYPDDSLVKLLGDKSGLSYNGAVLRLIDTKAFFCGTPPEFPKKGDEAVIVVSERHEVALKVDRIFNHQQIVVKVFGRGYHHFRDIPGIYGYTILGNEDVVLILDVAKMAREDFGTEGLGDGETGRRDDKGTRGQGDRETRRHGDTWTR